VGLFFRFILKKGGGSYKEIFSLKWKNGDNEMRRLFKPLLSGIGNLQGLIDNRIG
jgi:hypothetical protein